MPDIDFVVPFVDGSDPAWQAERQKYIEENESDTADHSDHRYRDWGLFPFFFRCVEENAPWFRKLFLIVSSEEQIPAWLNRSHPKLSIVLHKDFIPEAYLPTFSSHCIDVNLHRIPGLSEHFVYFNDDTFLIRKVSPSFFFKKGLPRDTAILRPWPFLAVKKGEKPLLTALHDMIVINRNFDKPACMRRYFYKWFSPRMGIRIASTFWLLPAREFTGFTNLHLMNPFLKSTFEEVWKKEAEVLETSSSHRFRESFDVNQYLFQYWQFASGKFVPRAHEVGRSRTINRENMDDITRFITGGKYKAIALNDSELSDETFAELKEEVIRLFTSAFPEKSSFEV